MESIVDRKKYSFFAVALGLRLGFAVQEMLRVGGRSGEDLRNSVSEYLRTIGSILDCNPPLAMEGGFISVGLGFWEESPLGVRSSPFVVAGDSTIPYCFIVDYAGRIAAFLAAHPEFDPFDKNGISKDEISRVMSWRMID